MEPVCDMIKLRFTGIQGTKKRDVDQNDSSQHRMFELLGM